MISTLYGKDSVTKKVYQSFGAINQEGGWRRLNVMLTRARQRMEVFTSLKSIEIQADEKSKRGAREFKKFLEFLENNNSISKIKFNNERGFDSDFEESDFEVLKEYGFEAVPQLGVNGYRIDLAVISQKNPQNFVLAIECDGATYHSSKSARDRDRLRQEILEKLGWQFYRIWSTD